MKLADYNSRYAALQRLGEVLPEGREEKVLLGF